MTDHELLEGGESRPFSHTLLIVAGMILAAVGIGFGSVYGLAAVGLI